MFSIILTAIAFTFIMYIKGIDSTAPASALTCDVCNYQSCPIPSGEYCELSCDLPTPSEDLSQSEDQYPDTDETADLWFDFQTHTPIQCVDFTAMNIRQLKKEASAAKIKGYCNMRKHELIQALTK